MDTLDFPYRIDGRGRTAGTGADDHLRDLIEQVLFTSPGERVMRPDFGCGLAQLVFEPNSVTLAATTQMLVQSSLQQHLSHLIALSTAILVGIQFWHADQGGVYVLWYLPLILLMVFRPGLSSAEPPEPGTGLMARWAGAAWRRVRPGPPPKELAV